MPTVLLIEDDRNCARLVTKVLEPHGFTIAHATGGLAGLKLAREIHPNVILVDMDLPDLDGRAVVVQLRGINALHGVPVIAFTAQPGARARRIALAVGCDDFISKPIDTRALPTQISDFINRVHA